MFPWTKACDHNIHELKRRLTIAPILTLPHGDEVILSILMPQELY